MAETGSLHYLFRFDNLLAMDMMESGRLPTNVRPVHYDLMLEPDLETFMFRGRVDIRLDVLEETTSITLHAIDLAIDDPQVSNQRVANLYRNKDKQTVTVHLHEPLTAGQTTTLSLHFEGVLNDSMAGLYRSSFTDASGQKHFLAVSHMEPTDARRAFPCFDEPALKATFSVTLVAADNLTCLSNMDVKSVRAIDSAKKEVVFNTTPPMSTYFVAFLVGELTVIETDIYHIPVRLFATPGIELDRLGSFALELTARTLAFYDEQFDSPFPLPKMDIVAVPDFVGAMENWGLVIYREADLLLDLDASPVTSKQRVVLLVQHELAHQWFGNLVTMEYWDGLWLNEGFATWMAWYACDAFYPEWGVWQMYVAEKLQRGLALDALRSSHPIQVPLRGEDEIGQIFDDISYAKGACVLRMIAGALGEEVFLSGVRLYLRKHAYSNATTEDLWAALTEASGQRVGDMMHAWTRELGFPVLTVTKDGSTNTINVRQTRFLATADLQPGEDDTIYPVSLGLRNMDGVATDLMLTGREWTFPVAGLDLFKFNANHTGFYRTAYSADRLKRLGVAAARGSLTVEDRVGLIADAAALAAAGHQQTTGMLSLVDNLKSETEYFVWKQVIASVDSMHAAWMHVPKTQNALQAFENQLVRDKAHELGWAIDEHDGGKQIFAAFRTGERSAIHPDLRAAVFQYALQRGGETERDIILDEFRTAPTSDGRITALAALGHAREPQLVQRTTAMLLSDEVRLQGIHVPMTTLRTHPNGIAGLWTWMTQNWPVIKERLSSGLAVLTMVIGLRTSGFTTDEQREAVQLFFRETGTEGFDQPLQQSLDEIRTKARWVERDGENVQKWLDSYRGSNGSWGSFGCILSLVST
ncbi:aminopeptidase 2 [Aspergillus sclerotiicarbonarius CBS 121057]|uniref:Aminopeptidase n=1 Tax=Aspergillus sclerotiicarbonarius (strain CBS 121057 / IBT 28362) TaxID=1448318 RepID=A0A319E8K5_ASPSB|nr:aminopeptidase 2 [Aspergillus sclerotiicarbonarius CBS 121057]